MENTCYEGLITTYSEIDKAHKGRRNMAIEDQSQGSKRGHGRGDNNSNENDMIQEEFYRDIAKLKRIST